MPRTHQALQGGAAASSSASKMANYQHSPAHRGRLSNEPVNLYVASAWPLPNGSPHGLKDSEKDRLGHAQASGTVSPVSKTTSTQLSEGHAVGQPRSFFGTPTRPLPRASPTSHKKGSGKQRLRQFWAQVLEKPDTALLLSPSRQQPQMADGCRADKKTSKCSSTNIKGRAAALTKDQCRSPFTLVQPKEITGCQVSRLPRLVKSSVRTAASNESEQARALPQSIPASPFSYYCRQRIADIQAEGIWSKKGSELPQHIKPSVPLAEHNISERKPARSLLVDALPTGDRMRETSEALTAGIEAKMYTPMRSKSSLRHTDRKGSDMSLSSGCSYSPLPPSVVPDFKTPDLEQFRSPFKDCTIHRNPSKGLAMRYDDSSSDLDSPVSTTIDVKKIVAFPIPDTPAHYSGTPELSDSPELFTLPVNVTMRRRRATRNVSPLVLPELLPEHLTERLEQEPEGNKDGESDESDYSEDMGGATEIPSARAPTVPLFPSPDLAAYRRIIHEEMARYYSAHIVSPVSTAESPASTVSGVSTGGHISSPPAVETTPASSPSTLATAFAGLSAQPRLSPILKLSSQQKGHLSTVLECTETSDKGSGTTALWAHPEESLITNAKQPSLIDGNFSCISPSVAFGHEELDPQSEQPLSDSLLSFMKHERSILQASLDEGAILPNS
ncbi:uncharacterized protein LOC142784684 isoform X2 [Rhipicephalus microplus]|uniref:uncharacterized protein LOC142784684 isoform X2 n=1 Tax=Rhipicephalus microplus TaxID=6941 RepID=UPI003F6C543D